MAVADHNLLVGCSWSRPDGAQTGCQCPENNRAWQGAFRSCCSCRRPRDPTKRRSVRSVALVVCLLSHLCSEFEEDSRTSPSWTKLSRAFARVSLWSLASHVLRETSEQLSACQPLPCAVPLCVSSAFKVGLTSEMPPARQCRRPTSVHSQGMALPAGACGDSSSLLRRLCLPQKLPALCQHQ